MKSLCVWLLLICHLKDLEALFQHKVLEMLLKRGKITKKLISLLLSWRHTGFNVFCGKRIFPEGQEIIKLYYQWSPLIVKAMEGDKAFKQEVKGMSNGVLELIGGGVE